MANRQEDRQRSARWRFDSDGVPQTPPIGLGIAVGSLTINVLSLALPIVILQVYDRVLPNAATETLGFLVAGLTVALILDACLRLVRTLLANWHAARFEHAMNCQGVDRLLATDIQSFERDALGVHLERLQAIGRLRDYYAGQSRLVLMDLPFITLFLGLIWLIAGPLVWVPLGTLLLLGITALTFGGVLRRALAARAEVDDRRYSFIIDALSGILTVKGLAMEPMMLRRYERLQESSAGETYRSIFFSSVAQSLGALFSNMTMVAVASFGAALVIAGDLTIGGLAACTLLSGRMIQPLLRGLGLWTQIQNVGLSRDRAQELFRMPADAPPSLPEIGPLGGAIELKDISFRFEKDGPLLLNRIDLKIEPGQTIGITGGTGSGKSTLLALMTNSLRPSSGSILYDGKSTVDFEPRSLRRQIAHLPQSAALFQGTILDNLTMFRGPAAVDRALESCRLLGIDRHIEQLPAGYQTEVGSGAQEDLAAGIVRGIAMARELVDESPILFFDEANGSLDRSHDAVLKSALSSLKGRRTMVIVSHRPSLLALTDKVFELRAGSLKEVTGAVPSSGQGRLTPHSSEEGEETPWPAVASILGAM